MTISCFSKAAQQIVCLCMLRAHKINKSQLLLASAQCAINSKSLFPFLFIYFQGVNICVKSPFNEYKRLILLNSLRLVWIWFEHPPSTFRYLTTSFHLTGYFSWQQCRGKSHFEHRKSSYKHVKRPDRQSLIDNKVKETGLQNYSKTQKPIIE